MVTQSKYDMLLAIPAEVVQVYFPNNTQKEYQKAAKHLENKLKQFKDNFESRLYPVSGKYILDQFQKLCETMPELMCSVVFMGKDEAGYTFPVVQNEAIETKPAWELLNFELIIQVERHLQAIGQNLLRSRLGPDEKQKVYGDLKRQIENLAGARHYRDIRGIYGLLYSELRLILKGLYQNMEHAWVFDKDKIDNLSTWIALRDDHFFILKLAQKLSGRVKTLVEFDKNAEIAIRTLTDSFKSLNAGESAKLLSYDDQPMSPPGRVADSGSDQFIDDFDTLEIMTPEIHNNKSKLSFFLSSLKSGKSTRMVQIGVADATFLYFLARQRIENNDDWLESPRDQTDLLKIIRELFNNGISDTLRSDLLKKENHKSSSWLSGNSETLRKHASRINIAFAKASGIKNDLQTGQQLITSYSTKTKSGFRVIHSKITHIII